MEKLRRERAIVFIDGSNFYFKLKELTRDVSTESFAETVRTELSKLNPTDTLSKTENYYLLMGKRP